MTGLQPRPSVSGGMALRGGVTTLAGQVVKMIVLGVNLAVLGRLLTPADFGLVALALAVVGVAELVRDFGLSSAAIQAPHLTQVEKSNLFWLNFALGGFTAVLAVGAALPLERVLDTDNLAKVICSLAIVFLVNGIGTQFQAQLARDFRFGVLAMTDIVSQSCGLAVGVVLALQGAGFWALVILQITAAVVATVLRAVLSRWRPSWPSRSTSIRPYLRFGLNLGAAQILGYLANAAPTVALGAAQGPTSVGLYSRSAQLVNIPINQVFGPLTNVALSALSRASDPGRYMRAARELALWINLAGLLAFSAFAGLAPVLVPMIFGNQWGGAVHVVTILAVGAIFQGLTYPYFWVFMSLNRTADLLRYNFVTKVGLGTTAVFGSLHSTTGAAIGFATGLAISWPVCALWLRNESRIDVRGHFQQSVRLLLAALMSAGVTAVVVDRVETQGAGAALVVGILVWAPTFCCAWILAGGRRDLNTVWHRMAPLLRRASA